MTARTLARRKLPIGIQTFAKLREEDHYYVDKTAYALQLVAQGSCYFLSRPRRFGKSLFLDTLKELFEGNRALFTGLYAEEHWDWARRYPVIRISFGGGILTSGADLQDSLDGQLLRYETALGLAQQQLSMRRRLSHLIATWHERSGERVVVLVDEYDKPILDNITDVPTATAMREALKDIYSVLKDSDEHLKFVFLTGVSKFSKVSLFSGLNNLEDITLDVHFSAICGYTDADVDSVFAPELPGLDREEIRRWYNGYNWLGEGVYNPFDVLLLFRHRDFRPYWFETGTPTFLVKLLAERQFFSPDLSRVVAQEHILSAFDVADIATEALLFQTGYLTVDSVWHIPGRTEFTLKYPNLEVQASLNESLLGQLCGSRSVPGRQVSQLYRLLASRDFIALKNLFHAFYASIPHDWYRKNELAGFEGYYASIFYSYFAAVGLDIRLEDTTNHGRIDVTVLFQGAVLLFEFKVVELAPEGKALQQLKDRAYAEKYRARAEPIYLIGVEFSRATRNIVGFEIENQSALIG